jgi:hypothetical protein
MRTIRREARAEAVLEAHTVAEKQTGQQGPKRLKTLAKYFRGISERDVNYLWSPLGDG